MEIGTRVYNKFRGMSGVIIDSKYDHDFSPILYKIQILGEGNEDNVWLLGVKDFYNDWTSNYNESYYHYNEDDGLEDIPEENWKIETEDYTKMINDATTYDNVEDLIKDVRSYIKEYNSNHDDKIETESCDFPRELLLGFICKKTNKLWRIPIRTFCDSKYKEYTRTQKGKLQFNQLLSGNVEEI